MNVAFDTLQYADALEAAGVSAPQAKAQAKALASVLNESVNNVLATKADVNKIEAQLVLTREHFDAKIDKLFWMGGIAIAFLGSIVAKLFF